MFEDTADFLDLLMSRAFLLFKIGYQLLKKIVPLLVCDTYWTSLQYNALGILTSGREARRMLGKAYVLQ